MPKKILFVFLVKICLNSQINAASVDRTQCLQISISEVGFSLALSQLFIVSDDPWIECPEQLT